MNKRLIVVAILVSALLMNIASSGSFNFFASIAKAEPVKDTLVAEMISKIDKTEIYNVAYALQNFATREYGYPENVEAATYLYNRLSSISGLSVEYQSDYNNIVATLPGVDLTSSVTYIVGAHYDSISNIEGFAPGASDNGAGVAVVLEFARIMSQYSFSHTLKFALWNAEEKVELGSLEYVKYAYSNNVNVQLYMNLDAICYDPYSQMMLDVVSNDQSSWVSDMMTDYNSIYGIDLILTYTQNLGGTDHRSFWTYGYPAVWLRSDPYGPIHTEWDTIERVYPAYAQKNGQLCMSVLAALAKGVATPPEPTPSPSPTPVLHQPQHRNLALKSPPYTATASTYNGITYGPLNAIDGVESKSNYWGTSAAIGLPQWLKIDLGTTNNINKTTTHFYDGDERIYTYYIETSADDYAWTRVVSTKTASSVVTDDVLSGGC